MNEEKQIPQGTVFTLIVPLDRNKTKFATFYLKEIEEAVFMAAKSMIDVKKEFDAIRLIVEGCSLPGSDSVSLLRDNFLAARAASPKVIDFISPMEAELKKN